MKLNNKCKVIHNVKKDKTILANLDTGEWILIPFSCWKILEKTIKNEWDMDMVCNAAYDEADKEYLYDMFRKLKNAEFIVDEKKDSASSIVNIRKVYFNLTYRCNLACNHCCVDAKHVTEFTRADEMDRSSIFKAIDKIAKLNPDILILSGGEPMVRDDFGNILRYIRPKFAKEICLSTNATLISEKNVDLLSNCIDRFDISIDGVDEKSCAKVRGEGVFKKVIRSVNLLKQYGNDNIHLSMMFGDFNDYLRGKFLELCQELSTEPLMRAFEPMGRGADNWGKFEKPIEISNKEKTLYSPAELKKAREEISCFNCTAGKSEIMINPKGDIFPCGNLNCDKYRLGNILCIDNVGEYLEEKQKTKAIDDGYQILEEEMPYNFSYCKECRVNLFCWSCISGIRNRYRDKERFKVECQDKKKALYQLIWDEDEE